MNRDREKQNAAARGLEFVQDGMKLGLGSGSTVAHLVALLGKRIREHGLHVECVPTSRETERLAEREGVPLTNLQALGKLDLTIDGADEVDGSLNLIKGGGGALLREKVVAWSSRRLAIIADAGKQVETLGRFPLPVEVLQFAWKPIANEVESWGCAPSLRRRPTGEPFITDEGNYVLDCAFRTITEPLVLARRLESLPGVMAHGLFIGMAEIAIIGDKDEVKVITRP